MLWYARKLLTQTEIRWGFDEIDDPHVAVNVLKNIRIFGHIATYTEGDAFGIEFKLFIHHHNIVNQILWCLKRKSIGKNQFFAIKKKNLHKTISDIGKNLMPIPYFCHFLAALYQS